MHIWAPIEARRHIFEIPDNISLSCLVLVPDNFSIHFSWLIGVREPNFVCLAASLTIHHYLLRLVLEVGKDAFHHVQVLFLRFLNLRRPILLSKHWVIHVGFNLDSGWSVLFLLLLVYRIFLWMVNDNSFGRHV